MPGLRDRKLRRSQWGPLLRLECEISDKKEKQIVPIELIIHMFDHLEEFLQNAHVYLARHISTV